MIYYFAGTAYNSIGNESDFSEELVWTSRVAGAVGVTTNPPRDKYRQPAGGHGFLAENAYFSTFRILGMSGTPRIYLDPLEVFGPGQPGICTLDRCSNLPRGEWTPVFALTNSTDRLLTYTETVTNRMLFYRLRVGY
jgi:hypothetical protein